MNRKVQEIYRLFDGKLIGTNRMKQLACEAVSLLPTEMIAYVCRNCWFVSSMEDAWGFAFTGNDLTGQHLIFLSDDLLHQSSKQIEFTILHEIGHVMLRHRNSVIEKQSAREIRRQEREADEFARQYLTS